MSLFGSSLLLSSNRSISSKRFKQFRRLERIELCKESVSQPLDHRKTRDVALHLRNVGENLAAKGCLYLAQVFFLHGNPIFEVLGDIVLAEFRRQHPVHHI